MRSCWTRNSMKFVSIDSVECFGFYRCKETDKSYIPRKQVYFVKNYVLFKKKEYLCTNSNNSRNLIAFWFWLRKCESSLIYFFMHTFKSVWYAVWWVIWVKRILISNRIGENRSQIIIWHFHLNSLPFAIVPNVLKIHTSIHEIRSFFPHFLDADCVILSKDGNELSLQLCWK